MKEQNVTCVSYEQNIYVNKDLMIHRCGCYQSTFKITFVVLYKMYYPHVDTNG